MAEETYLFSCGRYFNARIGNKLDFIDGVDNISMLNVLDTGTNGHCEPFIDFLMGTELCIFNGRVNGKK